MRVLHFRERLDRQDDARGIGAHTDYGMLVIAAQDEVGGLFIRPPLPEWRSKNWCQTESAAGVYENDDGWFFVPPKEGTLTCFPGDMFQFLTSGFFLATPHKVSLKSFYSNLARFNFVVQGFNPKCGLFEVALLQSGAGS